MVILQVDEACLFLSFELVEERSLLAVIIIGVREPELTRAGLETAWSPQPGALPFLRLVGRRVPMTCGLPVATYGSLPHRLDCKLLASGNLDKLVEELSVVLCYGSEIFYVTMASVDLVEPMMVLDFLVLALGYSIQVVCRPLAALDLSEIIVVLLHLSLSLFFQRYVFLNVYAAMQGHFVEVRAKAKL